MKPLIVMVIATAIFAATPEVPKIEAPTPASGAARREPVLLELFTSEGCSSCPPADNLLEALDRQPVAHAELIVLSEHVDYWNHLGWSDPYSSPVFSARQQDYSRRLGATVYTPQLVIDGKMQMVGSERAEIMKSITLAAKTEKLPVTVKATRVAQNVNVRVEANAGDANAVLYIVLAADHARSQVLTGENGGHSLNHVAVVQSITRIGKWEGTLGRNLTVPVKPSPGANGDTRVVAFLRGPRNGQILGVAAARF